MKWGIGVVRQAKIISETTPSLCVDHKAGLIDRWLWQAPPAQCQPHNNINNSEFAYNPNEHSLWIMMRVYYWVVWILISHLRGINWSLIISPAVSHSLRGCDNLASFRSHRHSVYRNVILFSSHAHIQLAWICLAQYTLEAVIVLA